VDFHFEEKVWDIDLPKENIYGSYGERGVERSIVYDIVFGATVLFREYRHKWQT